ncbi:MAG TPA: maleylpyruvate isomerase family mycothiol-dependent enzyme [Acidimicrobiales bacterium]
MSPPFIEQLAETWASTAAACRGLTDAQWDEATDCPGWTVRDQLSHVVGTESMLLGRSAPPAAPAGHAHVQNPIGELNEAWVQARRGRSGEDVLAEFIEVTGARLAALRAMSAEDLAAETASPIGRVPYATFMDVRVMDCWVHEQDIRRALDRPGHLDGPAAEAAISRLVSSFGYVVGKRAAPPDGTTAVLWLSGPVERTVSVVMRDGRAVVAPEPTDPTVRLVMDSETFACLAAGRWDGADAIEQGRVAFKGDAELGRRITTSLATIP